MPSEVGPFLQFGLGGAVLWWFMFRAVSALDRVQRATDRNSRALLLMALALPYSCFTDTSPLPTAAPTGTRTSRPPSPVRDQTVAGRPPTVTVGCRPKAWPRIQRGSPMTA